METLLDSVFYFSLTLTSLVEKSLDGIPSGIIARLFELGIRMLFLCANVQIMSRNECASISDNMHRVHCTDVQFMVHFICQGTIIFCRRDR